MIVLDENITRNQKILLDKKNIKSIQIGEGIGSKGQDDESILTLLQNEKDVLFFTGDAGFFDKHFCHSHYCIVYLELHREEHARFIELFIKHPLFNTKKKRAGKVIKLNQAGIRYWILQSSKQQFEKL